MYTKFCKKCSSFKLVNEFGSYKQSRGNKIVIRTYCDICELKRSAEYEANNREKRREQKKEFYKNNTEKERARGKKYYVENLEKEKVRWSKYRDANRERLRERDRKRAKDQPAYFTHKTQKRHTAKLLRTPAWLTNQHWKEIETTYQLSQWCSEVTGVRYNVDHIIPLQGKTVCGLHVPWNLRVIPAADNFKKGNRIYE